MRWYSGCMREGRETVWNGPLNLRNETVDKYNKINHVAFASSTLFYFEATFPTAMASVLVPVLYVVIVFGSLYIFSYLYRRHNASEYVFSAPECVIKLFPHRQNGRAVFRLASRTQYIYDVTREIRPASF
jgi:hypothetical protein